LPAVPDPGGAPVAAPAAGRVAGHTWRGLDPTMVYDLEPAETDGPTPAELAAIEVESGLIAAELELTGAEIRVLTAEPHPTALDWRRLRRAEHRVAQEAKALAARRATGSIRPRVA
jgi:hypothetical protein